MGICIDPTLELVWRDPHTVQIGVDPARAVVALPGPAEERFLLGLRHETPRHALPALADRCGCPPAAAAALLAEAGPTLLEMRPEPLARVEVLGVVPLADLLEAHLVGEGVAVTRTRAPRGGPVPLPDPAPHLAVAVTEHVLDPAVRAAWSRRRVPHLSVVLGDGRIRIGPLVEPDDGPCLQCAELDRVDEDPHWPTVVAQVWGRGARPLSPYRASVVAARVVATVLDRLPGTTGTATGRQEQIERTDLTVRIRTVPQHPRCACRAPRGNGSASAPRLGTTRASTTSR